MRPDLAKVICEKERKGDRSYMGPYSKGLDKEYRFRGTEDRDDEYADLEALPKYESMTERLSEKRSFSENLGTIRGLIRKHVGKNWDKLYSAICAQVSPTGTNIERHVHQHIPDFIETQTRMGEHGVEIHAYAHGGRLRGPCWVLLKDAALYRADYYVHPVSRCIVRLKSVQRKYKPRRKEITRIDIDASHQLHRIDSVWWLVTLTEIPAHCYKPATIGLGLDGTVVRRSAHIDLPSQDILISHTILTEQGLFDRYGRKGVYGVRKAPPKHVVLAAHGIAA